MNVCIIDSFCYIFRNFNLSESCTCPIKGQLGKTKTIAEQHNGKNDLKNTGTLRTQKNQELTIQRHRKYCVRVRVMAFNATFKNNSVISCRSVL